MLSAAHVKTSSTTTPRASSEPPPSPDSRSSRDGWLPKARPPPAGTGSFPACVPSPPTRSNYPRWHASAHSSVGVDCSSALPSRRVLRSVTNCGPTLSRTPTRATRTPSASPFFAAWPPARRCVPTQLQLRRDMRESVRDARRAAPPRPRAGLGRDVRHVGAGARGAPAPARARGTTASTARFSFCVTCSSRCTTTQRKGRRCCASVAARAYLLREPRPLVGCGPQADE
jgi:hypothetical protein